jgi:hypothetical protein
MTANLPVHRVGFSVFDDLKIRKDKLDTFLCEYAKELWSFRRIFNSGKCGVCFVHKTP